MNTQVCGAITYPMRYLSPIMFYSMDTIFLNILHPFYTR